MEFSPFEITLIKNDLENDLKLNSLHIHTHSKLNQSQNSIDTDE